MSFRVVRCWGLESTQPYLTSYGLRTTVTCHPVGGSDAESTDFIRRNNCNPCELAIREIDSSCARSEGHIQTGGVSKQFSAKIPADYEEIKKVNRELYTILAGVKKNLPKKE